MTGKIIEIILRSIFTYIILLVLGRIMGRKLILNIIFYHFIYNVEEVFYAGLNSSEILYISTKTKQ
ncbi:hypothetical protein AAGC94_10020 [Clostridium sporogenes]|uniref:hypothetical protein n=1 Tax=Clostridium sporogenes TaxID=1509 RepID=UPI00024BA367|nr:hypothetical protein [Clostridium sporogenes]EHN15922.1 hypothetical protein IYC_06369 [Clostridium sporogenes PA 3679]KYN77889.1 hypothetical protein A0J52_00995 [Clostridium sporogenes]MCF4016165.1 hypothetical protein [Clostridium sporogenes]MCW6061794.1 hypothetical protein [Clostridium sporogenes]MCW6067876.1 hypothetical protein [Clostridium sporogenes]